MFNKYWYYENSVQNPSNEVELFNEKFEEIRGKKAYTLREDFCGTAAISCEWVKQSPKHLAFGIDLDPEPIAYGKEHHLAKIEKEAQKRMNYIEGNVLDAPNEATDIIFAFNFSYFIFKERETLLNYFKAVHRDLNDSGVFFMDIFGGPDSQTLCEDEIEHDDYSYFWECQKFNPLNHDCRFAIHFKLDDEKSKRKNVFTYSWRMWTIPEIKDLLLEAGFKSVNTYWEEDDEDGDGNGNFYMSDEEENCDAWVTYISAVK